MASTKMELYGARPALITSMYFLIIINCRILFVHFLCFADIIALRSALYKKKVEYIYIFVHKLLFYLRMCMVHKILNFRVTLIIMIHEMYMSSFMRYISNNLNFKYADWLICKTVPYNTHIECSVFCPYMKHILKTSSFSLPILRSSARLPETYHVAAKINIDFYPMTYIFSDSEATITRGIWSHIPLPWFTGRGIWKPFWMPLTV